MATLDYSKADAKTLRIWRDGAWQANRIDVLDAIHAEFVRRGGCGTETCTHPACVSAK